MKDRKTIPFLLSFALLISIAGCKEQEQVKQEECDILCEEAKEKNKIKLEIETLKAKKDSLWEILSQRMVPKESNEDKIEAEYIVGVYFSINAKELAKEFDDVHIKILDMEDSLRGIGNSPYGEHFWKKIFGESIADFAESIDKVYYWERRGISSDIEKLIEKDRAGVAWVSFVRKLYDLRLYEWNRFYDNSSTDSWLTWVLKITPSDSSKPVIKFAGKRWAPKWKELEEAIESAKGARDLIEPLKTQLPLGNGNLLKKVAQR